MQVGQISLTSKPFGMQLLSFQTKCYFLKKFYTQNNYFLDWSEAKAGLM